MTQPFADGGPLGSADVSRSESVVFYSNDDGQVLFVRQADGCDEDGSLIISAVEPMMMPAGGALTFAQEFLSSDVPWGEPWDIRSETGMGGPWFRVKPYRDWLFLDGFQSVGYMDCRVTVLLQHLMLPTLLRYFGFDYERPDPEQTEI